MATPHQVVDHTEISLPKMAGFLAFRDYIANGYDYTAWGNGTRFFVELTGSRLFRFAAPSLRAAEQALLRRLDLVESLMRTQGITHDEAADMAKTVSLRRDAQHACARCGMIVPDR